jgi:hypothetical protein
MSFLRKLLGLSEPESLPRVIPTSHWAGHFASLIAAQIPRSGLTELRQMAAFISRTDNRPGLCGGQDGKLPNMADDPDVLVYCYLKDVPTFTSIAPTIERLIQLSAIEAEILAKYTTDSSHMQQSLNDIVESPMVDQIAFGVACELEEKVKQLMTATPNQSMELTASRCYI